MERLYHINDESRKDMSQGVYSARTAGNLKPSKVKRLSLRLGHALSHGRFQIMKLGRGWRMAVALTGWPHRGAGDVVSGIRPCIRLSERLQT